MAIGVGCLGTAIGWLTACCRFPARGLLTIAQLIPLAIPAYLEAAVITDLGSRHGLRLHGISWAAAVLILSTMPYVVLLSRDSFRQSGRRHLEASRSLGLAAWGSFKRVALPMALPAIASGIALAGMEVVNEFGAVELLGVPTLSTGLLQRWQGRATPRVPQALPSLPLPWWLCWWRRNAGKGALVAAGIKPAPAIALRAGSYMALGPGLPQAFASCRPY